QHEFGSILKFVESNWGLGTLGYTDARADDLSDCFNYNQSPIVFRSIAASVSTASIMKQGLSQSIPDSDF
ncbi:MAG: hypothetical protein M3N13_09750, partial [Candidatus Eremiobacteraeota bacterium]|nr:hypothetical protein [Candidatus Eremiobacteraeota bacterium]